MSDNNKESGTSQEKPNTGNPDWDKKPPVETGWVKNTDDSKNKERR